MTEPQVSPADVQSAPVSAGLGRGELLELYRKMLLIRRFDQQARQLFMRNLIRGTTHTYTGQEAVAVGACAALRPDDYITSTHRGHGHCLAKGGDPKAMMAELLGRSTGYCKGKGGSMHIADVDLGILGANGIVGGGIGIATGAAYSCKYWGTDRLALAFFGDGAINQGIFYESANMASLWKLPVIYLCEENQYAEFSPNRLFKSVEDLSVRASAFGMPGYVVDGNDVLAVYDLVSQAAARVRAGDGPALIVAQTYRLEGHTVGDPLSYRPAGESEAWWQREPIARFRQFLIDEKALDEADLQAVEDAAEAEIEAAVRFALDSPHPDINEVWSDVTVEATWTAS